MVMRRARAEMSSNSTSRGTPSFQLPAFGRKNVPTEVWCSPLPRGRPAVAVLLRSSDVLYALCLLLRALEKSSLRDLLALHRGSQLPGLLLA